MTTSNTGERLYRGPAPATAPNGSGSRLRDRGGAGRAAGGPARGRAAARGRPCPAGGTARAKPAPAPRAGLQATAAGRGSRRPGSRPDGGIPAAAAATWASTSSAGGARVAPPRARRRAAPPAGRAAPALATVSLIALAGGDTRSPWLLASLVGDRARRVRRAALAPASRSSRRRGCSIASSGCAIASAPPSSCPATAASRRPAARHPSGLGALVAGEARAAVAASFDGARLRLPRAGAEWAALVALGAALGLLVALPAARHAGAPSRPAAATSRLSAGARPASGSPARAGSHRAAARTRTHCVFGRGRRAAWRRRAARPAPQRPAARARRRRGGAQPGHRRLGRPAATAVHRRLPLRRRAHERCAPRPVRGRADARRIARRRPRRAERGVGRSGRAQPVVGAREPPLAARAAVRARAPDARTASRTAAATRPAATARATSRAAPAWARASSRTCPHSSVGLPLQAGYAPSAARRPRSGEGTSQVPDGGAGPSRAVQVDGGATTGGSAFRVIPPTTDAVPAGEALPLSDYFGVSNQQVPGRW